jgi:hypothetical protein
MRNILGELGCPHGRFDYCYVCEQLEIEAQRELDFDSGEVTPEGGEFVE